MFDPELRTDKALTVGLFTNDTKQIFTNSYQSSTWRRPAAEFYPPDAIPSNIE